MEDYTKFRLKSKEELIPFLADKDELFIVACNKCFKEFEAMDEPECNQLEELITEQGKHVCGCTKVDFLCNKTQTENKLTLPPEAKNVFVISCGLGIQTVAGLLDLPVYAASDSIAYTGHHGMALTDRRCDACGQCYLNLTGGICPIVDCSKSLVNGQCGGCKNGKCEVDGNKDCAWDKIYARLDKQGRTSQLLEQPVQVRDYSKINFKFVQTYVNEIRIQRFEGYYGGIHPSERKELSEHLPLKRFPEPELVVLPLSQHAGAPATPIVAVNDTVKMGQKIAEAGGFVSAPVHASVSGTVVAIEPRRHPITGADVLSIVIFSDGKQTLDESVQPYGNLETLSLEEIVDIVREKGIVGMGGAGFPTSVKLKPAKPIDTVLINGCECEPLLTADHRIMVEFADETIFGLQVILKSVNAEKGIIVIEDNKLDAIALMQQKVADIPNIEVLAAKTKYPQGAEKMLIKRVLKRKVPSGGLPMDVGVIVSNTSTLKAISDAIQKGMPLIERVVTVTGERLAHPGNYIVKIGTPVKDVLDYCGGITGDDTLIKLGGPMMGFPIEHLDVPVIKGTNGIIAIEKTVSVASPCIKCGRCVDVCPMELSPLNFPKLAEEEKWTEMKERSVRDCIECRCCEFICSAKIPIVSSIKAGKKAIMEMERK